MYIKRFSISELKTEVLVGFFFYFIIIIIVVGNIGSIILEKSMATVNDYH